MGEGTTRVVEANGAGTRVRELGEEITHVRNRLDAIVVELDRRRHRVTDLKRHVRRHARSIAVGVLVVAALAGAASVVLARTRPTGREKLARRGAELKGKARRLGQALGRIAHDPERLAPPRQPVFGASTLVAIGLTAAQLLAKRLMSAHGSPRIVTRGGRLA